MRIAGHEETLSTPAPHRLSGYSVLKNGVLIDTGPNASTELNDQNLQIGSAAAASYVAGSLAGASLVAEQWALYTILNAFMTAVGAI